MNKKIIIREEPSENKSSQSKLKLSHLNLNESNHNNEIRIESKEDTHLNEEKYLIHETIS